MSHPYRDPYVPPAPTRPSWLERWFCYLGFHRRRDVGQRAGYFGMVVSVHQRCTTPGCKHQRLLVYYPFAVRVRALDDAP